MRPFFRDPRRVAGIGALLVLVVATLRGFPQREAKADPPDLGPAGWGTLDARVVSPDLARRALIRYALLCEPAKGLRGNKQIDHRPTGDIV